MPRRSALRDGQDEAVVTGRCPLAHADSPRIWRDARLCTTCEFLPPSCVSRCGEREGGLPAWASGRKKSRLD